MGSSPGGGDSGAPAQQGPPISQLQPAQGPPRYPQFINGGGYQSGLTPEMLAAIQGNGGASAGPPPMAPGGPAGVAGAPPGAVDQRRQMLAQALAAYQTPERGYNPARGGGSGGMGAGGMGGMGGMHGRTA